MSRAHWLYQVSDDRKAGADVLVRDVPEEDEEEEEEEPDDDGDDEGEDADEDDGYSE
jgi:hypothetical protein